jgi:hypothetical protein
MNDALTIIGPLSLASAVVVAASAIVALVPLMHHKGAFSFAWQRLMGVLPARKRTWGTVYDANTKQPVPFAKVQLVNEQKRVLETRIADRQGRYGFLTTPDSLLANKVTIAIMVSARGYAFPSRAPVTVDTFIYNNLYYGAPVTVQDKTLVNFDIPMDPLRPSHAPLVVKSPSVALGVTVAMLADAGFWLGAFVVPLNLILMPNPFTLGVLFLFLGTASLRIWGITEHPFGTIKDLTTGTAMPFALVTLNDVSGKRVAFAVSDELGRYFMAVPRGAYELTVVTSASVTPPRQVKEHITAHKGWLTASIPI